MSVKRSRITRSSSLGEICMFDQVKPIESPTSLWEKRTALQNSVKILKPLVVKLDQPRGRILTLGSPVRETSMEGSEMKFDGRIGGFLEACCCCKKKIGEKDEVFMYSYLRAFCSAECRDKQIALDKEVEEASGKSAETESEWKLNNVNGLVGPQSGNGTAS